ncbi:MAG: molybdopterin-dependent oxidoreductase [Elusimicrobiales bacterium]|nr:molybdopterin-dependent oxidoreductase [Elusimicrobiales bacterium]
MKIKTQKIDNKFRIVNRNVEKIDSLSLACGKPLFCGDVDLPNMIYGKIMFSPHPHAIIKNVDTSQAAKIKGVEAIITYKDLPRVAHTKAGQGYPEPSPYDTFILDKKVRYVGDRVCAVAAKTPDICEEAISKIKVDWEILPCVFDVFESMKGEVIIHDENDSKNIPDKYHNIAAKVEDMHIIKNGEWFSNADYIIENTYSMPYLQHCAIEPHTVITYFDEYGRLIIRSSTQVPFHVRRIISNVLQIPIKNIRVIKPRIGGGFGSKQEIVIEDICAALTLKTKKPVKMEYTRRDVFISSRTRHPAFIKLKTGVKKNGVITDVDMDVTLNTGAYGSHALTVLMCSGSHTLPMYKIKNNLKFSGRSVYTNMPVSGAYRGYGATQAFFALEVQMDIMAEKIGMDLIEFRKKNYIKVGETSPVFKAMGEGREGVEQYVLSSGLHQAIDKGVEEIRWYEKRKKYERINKTNSRFKYGVGMAAMMQGSGIAEIDMASATIKMNEDGSFNLLIGATDIGTGSDTILAQIAAETLGVDTEDIIVYSSDTDLTPFDVGAYASSTTFVSGGAVKKAAEEIKKIILSDAAKIIGDDVSNLRIENKHVVSKNGKKVSFKEIAYTAFYYHNQHQIIASASHYGKTSPSPFAAHFVDLCVDKLTGIIKILKYVACVDCGTTINPILAKGQCEGAIVNGIGHSLYEEMEFSKNGVVTNASFRRYKIPTTKDIPEIKTIFIPTYEPDGPYGAKSVSEICINGPLPAIANAIYMAVGIRLFNPPFTPDKILKKLKELNKI